MNNPRALRVRDLSDAIAVLGDLGVLVNTSDRLPTIDFSHVTDERVLASLGLLTVDPAGRASVTAYDVSDHLVALLLALVEEHLTDPDRPNRGNAERSGEDGTTVIEFVALVELDTAGEFIERAVLRDQLDKPAGCRRCGGRCQTYKAFRGGWVCSRCAVEPTRYNDAAAEHLWLSRMSDARLRRKAVEAEQAGDFGEACELWNMLTRHSAPVCVLAMVARAASYIVARHERRVARQSSTAGSDRRG